MAEHCTEPIFWKIIRKISTTNNVLRTPNSEFIDFISAVFVVKLYFKKTHLGKAQKYLGGRLLSICTAMNVNEQQICIAPHCHYPAVTREVCLWTRGKICRWVVLPTKYLRILTTTVADPGGRAV